MTDQTNPTPDEQSRLQALAKRAKETAENEPARLEQRQREWLANNRQLADQMRAKADEIQAAIAAGHVPPAPTGPHIDQARIDAARVLLTDAQYKYFEAYRDYQESGRIPAHTPKERGAKGAAVRAAKRRLNEAETAVERASAHLERVLREYNE